MKKKRIFIILILIALTLTILVSLCFGKNNNKTFWTVVYSIILYFITQGILLVGVVILGLFNKDIMNLFTSNTINNFSILKTIMFFAIIIYSLFVILYTFINIKLFNKGVNVD